MGIPKEEPGVILVVSEKEEFFRFLKSALTGSGRQIEYAAGLTEAMKKISQERIFLLFLCSPFQTGSGVEEAVLLSERKMIPSVLVVNAEIYPETLYRTRNRRIYVLTYPVRKSMVLQTVSILYESQMQIYRLMKERDQLQERLTDLTVINRAKLILIQKEGLTEEEAHRALEKDAMDAGITKRKAAEYLIQRLDKPV